MNYKYTQRFVLNLIVFICLLTTLKSLGQVPSINQKQIESLVYRPLDNSNLYIATDSLNNTWIRGEFNPDQLHSPIIFQIPNAHIYAYDMYIYNFGKLHLVLPNLDSSGKFLETRFAQHYIITDNPVYYLNLHQNQEDHLKILILERGQFGAQEAKQLLFLGLYYGIAFLSIIFNILFYFIFKDKRFLFYSLLQIAIFISLFFEDGMFYYISNTQWEMKYLLAWNMPLTSMLACLFTIHFLDIKPIYQHYKIVFVTLFIVSFLTSLIYTLYPTYILFSIIIVISFIVPLFCLILAATQFRKNIYARFLLLTFSAIVLFGIGYTVQINTGIDQFSYFSINVFRFISAAEIITITFAIIYKVRDLQNQNNEYRLEIENYLQILDQKNSELLNSENVEHKIRHTSTLDSLREKYNLTSREIEVLECLWQGLSNNQISEKLFISLSTTKYHVSNLYTKLEIKSRTHIQQLKKEELN
ncbi:7TM diverse intracellular signaling domain-containing protein [Myroides odoratimimus]|uniref:7TM diverse intracellular signaling domain-containing protein n=1 Tax=Myroides odoratimimus TaxID=76832 RepID=UPI002575441A|nr:7TM diverse intracellular signaling domain-containing protein [Myroides odoratimimus]